MIFTCGMTNPMGTRYPSEIRWIQIRVQISTRGYEHGYKFLPTTLCWRTGNYSIRPVAIPNPTAYGWACILFHFFCKLTGITCTQPTKGHPEQQRLSDQLSSLALSLHIRGSLIGVCLATSPCWVDVPFHPIFYACMALCWRWRFHRQLYEHTSDIWNRVLDLCSRHWWSDGWQTVAGGLTVMAGGLIDRYWVVRELALIRLRSLLQEGPRREKLG
jgi:hypothetical protein